MATLGGYLKDVATWERSKKDKVYPAGTILLQVSATNGQLVYMDKEGTAASKYCAIMPNTEIIEPEYLYAIMEAITPDFLAKYQTTLNIQIDILDQYRLEYEIDRQTQKAIAMRNQLLKAEIEKEEQMIAGLKRMKAAMLERMFPAA